MSNQAPNPANPAVTLETPDKKPVQANPATGNRNLSLDGDGKMLPAVPQAATVPSFLVGKGNVGLSQARPEDIIHPRIVATQSNAKLVTNSRGDIPPGVLYHTGRKAVICPARTKIMAIPVTFAKGFIHWASRDSKKGVLGRETDPNGPIAKRAAEQLLAKRDGKKFTTADETFVESHDWLFYLLDLDDMVVCSYQVGGLSESKRLIGSIAARNLPPCATVMQLSPDIRDNPNGAFFVVGTSFADYNRDEALFNRLYALAQRFEKGGFKVEEPLDDEAPGAGGSAPDSSEFS